MRPPITTMLVEVTMPAMTKLFDLEGSTAKDGRKCDKMGFTYGYVAPFCNNNLHRSLCLVVGWIKHLIQSGFYDKTCKIWLSEHMYTVICVTCFICYNILQSAPANEVGQFTNPMGVLCSQFLVSCLSEDVHLRSVSQMGFRLVSMPKLLGKKVSRNQSLNPF